MEKVIGFYRYHYNDDVKFCYVLQDGNNIEVKLTDDLEEAKEIAAKYARDNGYTKENLDSIKDSKTFNFDDNDYLDVYAAIIDNYPLLHWERPVNMGDFFAMHEPTAYNFSFASPTPVSDETLDDDNFEFTSPLDPAYDSYDPDRNSSTSSSDSSNEENTIDVEDKDEEELTKFGIVKNKVHNIKKGIGKFLSKHKKIRKFCVRLAIVVGIIAGMATIGKFKINRDAPTGVVVETLGTDLDNINDVTDADNSDLESETEKEVETESTLEETAETKEEETVNAQIEVADNTNTGYSNSGSGNTNYGGGSSSNTGTVTTNPGSVNDGVLEFQQPDSIEEVETPDNSNENNSTVTDDNNIYEEEDTNLGNNTPDEDYSTVIDVPASENIVLNDEFVGNEEALSGDFQYADEGTISDSLPDPNTTATGDYVTSEEDLMGSVTDEEIEEVPVIQDEVAAEDTSLNDSNIITEEVPVEEVESDTTIIDVPAPEEETVVEDKIEEVPVQETESTATVIDVPAQEEEIEEVPVIQDEVTTEDTKATKANLEEMADQAIAAMENGETVEFVYDPDTNTYYAKPVTDVEQVSINAGLTK